MKPVINCRDFRYIFNCYKESGVSTIALVHPDHGYCDFLKNFLEIKGYEVFACTNNVEGYTIVTKKIPRLIIIYKDGAGLDGLGFLIKKNYSEKIRDIPVYVLGDFNPNEIVEYKKREVKAFLSLKINPHALLERLNIEFGYPAPTPKKKTPMLMDIHAKGNIIIIQIEGNLEPEKSVILSYLIRSFCGKNDIKTPRLFFIIPSLYPESITNENIEYLFRFIFFEELSISNEKVQILTGNENMKLLLSQHEVFRNFEIAQSYYDGFKKLQVDFDIETKVPVKFIKAGSVYLLDLYDKNGNVVVPAMTPVTSEVLQFLNEMKFDCLKYYGHMDITDIEQKKSVTPIQTLFEFITREFTPIKTDLFNISERDDKQNLFFSKVKGKNMVLISRDDSLSAVASHSLGPFFNIERIRSGENVPSYFDNKSYLIVFIDTTLPNEEVFSVLGEIRKRATRRQTTIMLLTSKLNKAQLIRYKEFGTDHVILKPFTSEKLRTKVFTSIMRDRLK